MSRKLLTSFAVVAGLSLATSVPLNAHHSSAMYGGDDVFLQGVVFSFEYVQPHSTLVTAHIQRDAEGNPMTNEDGSPVIVLWGWEMSSPSLLRERGVGPNFYVRGQPIVITGAPLRDGRPGALHGGDFVQITQEDGSFICRNNSGEEDELREAFPDFCPAEEDDEA